MSLIDNTDVTCYHFTEDYKKGWIDGIFSLDDAMRGVDANNAVSMSFTFITEEKSTSNEKLNVGTDGTVEPIGTVMTSSVISKTTTFFFENYLVEHGLHNVLHHLNNSVDFGNSLGRVTIQVRTPKTKS
jgi:hypothetical protein